MSPSIEDRLRAHFADRAARETLPGPENDALLQQALQGGGVARRAIGLDSGRMRARLAIAAAVVLLAGAAGAVAVLGDDQPDDVTTRNPSSTTEATHDSAPPSAPTSTSAGETGTTQAPPAGTTATGPIVAAEGILGSWSGSAWVPWEEGATPPLGDRYQVVRLDDPITTVVGTESESCGPAGNPSIDVGIDFGEKLSPEPIAVAGVPDPRPRPVEVLATDNPLYREAAVTVLADLGITDAAPTISQIVRGDLDGDGAAEVLVVAERLSDTGSWTAAEGDYSVVFMRRVQGGDFATTVVASWIAGPPSEFTQSIEALRLAALVDLNGDGRMEVVLDDAFWASSTKTVHELQRDGTLTEVLSVSCGV